MYGQWNIALQWRNNGCDGVSNHQPYDKLLNYLIRRGSKKTSKVRVTGLCAGNSQVTGEFPAQMASNAENVSIWWRHYFISFKEKTKIPFLVLKKWNALKKLHMHLWHVSIAHIGIYVSAWHTVKVNKPSQILRCERKRYTQSATFYFLLD